MNYAGLSYSRNSVFFKEHTFHSLLAWHQPSPTQMPTCVLFSSLGSSKADSEVTEPQRRLIPQSLSVEKQNIPMRSAPQLYLMCVERMEKKASLASPASRPMFNSGMIGLPVPTSPTLRDFLPHPTSAPLPRASSLCLHPLSWRHS